MTCPRRSGRHPCSTTGTRWNAPAAGCTSRTRRRRPAAHAGTVTYGVNFQAWCVFLMVMHHVPVERCADIIESMPGPGRRTDGALPASRAALLAAANTTIRALILLARVICGDETPLRADLPSEQKYLHRLHDLLPLPGERRCPRSAFLQHLHAPRVHTYQTILLHASPPLLPAATLTPHPTHHLPQSPLPYPPPLPTTSPPPIPQHLTSSPPSLLIPHPPNITPPPSPLPHTPTPPTIPHPPTHHHHLPPKPQSPLPHPTPPYPPTFTPHTIILHPSPPHPNPPPPPPLRGVCSTRSR